jgi:hypothetical protein
MEEKERGAREEASTLKGGVGERKGRKKREPPSS